MVEFVMSRRELYQSRPDIRAKEQAASREYQRTRRANWTPDELAAFQAQQREYRGAPEQYAKGRTRWNKWAERQIANGLCIACSDAATAGRYCDRHWLVSIGNRHGLTVKNGGVDLIAEIWDAQGGVCALTGEALIKGVNASLDHLLARAKGGDNSRGNLRWVHKIANTIKKDMTDEELVALCRRIVAHHDRGQQ